MGQYDWRSRIDLVELSGDGRFASYPRKIGGEIDGFAILRAGPLR